ncbi:MAG: hypothetical protein O3A00_09805 [Planctomycetota bacterium]|nr:hypothetical protein [Planctomycetota bacterium]
MRFSWRPNLEDEGDNKFVEAAIHTAAVIATYNVRDFRSPDFTPHGWTVMTPQEFLARYSSGKRNGHPSLPEHVESGEERFQSSGFSFCMVAASCRYPVAPAMAHLVPTLAKPVAHPFARATQPW